MDIRSNKEANAVFINVGGRMDAVTTPEFEKACDEWIQKGDKKLVINLERLDYISSAGLRGILSVGKKVKGDGGALVLCSLAGVVKQVFEVSGFSSIFPICDTPASALKKIQ